VTCRKQREPVASSTAGCISSSRNRQRTSRGMHGPLHHPG
jgi:hypothetical protein